MPLFYFHLHECGSVTLDDEGREFPDLAAAEEVATRDARSIMCGEVQEGRLCLACYIIIEDESRVEVRRVMFRDVLTITGYDPGSC